MLERLAGLEYYCFLDGFSGYFQIPIAFEDQEKTTFTCPYGTFAYKRIPFGLCNALATFQHCMMAIFHELIKDKFDIEIRDKRGAENLAADHLSRLKNPKLGKLTKAKIRDLFPKEQLMSITNQSNEPCVLIKLFVGASLEKRPPKSRINVIVVPLEDTIGLPRLQEKFMKLDFTGQTSFAMPEN
ncbi:hypothetical protein Tco_0385236 [Tanacetum coccineum]